MKVLQNIEIYMPTFCIVSEFPRIEPILWLLITTFILIGLYYLQFKRIKPVFAINIKEFNPELLKLISTTEEINPEFFEKEEILDMVDSKTIPQDSTDFIEVPSELIKYQELLKPVRFGILSLLNHYTRYVSADIRDVLKISWGKYTSHLNALEKEEMVVTETEFVDNNPRKIIQITPKGISEFNLLSTILQELVH